MYAMHTLYDIMFDLKMQISWALALILIADDVNAFKNIELLRPQMSHTQALLIVWEPCGHVASPGQNWHGIAFIWFIISHLVYPGLLLFLFHEIYAEARNSRNFRKISAALPLVFWTPENFRIHRTCYLWKKNTSYIPRYPTTTPYQSNTFPWHF